MSALEIYLKLLKGINDTLPALLAAIEGERIRRNLTEAQLEAFAEKTGVKIANLQARIDEFKKQLDE